MSKEIVFSKRGIETYHAVRAQLFNRWGQSVVTKFEKKTVEKLDLISKSPLIYKAVMNYPNIRKGLIHKNCSVFYEIKQHKIEILFFWDNRQDPIL